MLADEFFLGTKLYQKKFVELCKPIMRHLGLTHTIYVNVDKHGRMFSICTHHTWVERFIEEQYYKLDPLMVHPKNMSSRIHDFISPVTKELTVTKALPKPYL